MIDTPSLTPLPAFDLQAWQDRQAREAKQAAQILPGNKAVLFDALAAAGIAVVTVVFDGYGDSGQIEDIEAKTGDLVIALPPDQIDIAAVDWGSDKAQTITMSIRQAIETLVYAFLEQTHCGWEDNDGAYGDFTFSVADRTISLNYNERYTSSENFTHEF